MRVSLFTIGLVACLCVTVAAWSKEDQEIFRLRDEVAAAEGDETTFYDFLGIKAHANQDDINKAYRKRSRELHPDKAKRKFVTDRTAYKRKPELKTPGVKYRDPTEAEIKVAAKAASDRFARLGIVTNILRGGGRERYDHFLSNGFPKWKGTGYYYARFRPGLGSVLLGLFLFVGGGGHWLALYMSWKRQREFVERYIKFARHAAWGDNLGIPGLDGAGAVPAPAPAAEETDPNAPPMNRRMRRLQEKDSRKDKNDKKSKGSARGSPIGTPPVGATGARKRVVAENGKILVVDSAGNVYLEQEDEEGETHEFLLDPNELSQPTIKDTALVRLPLWAIHLVTQRQSKRAASPTSDPESEDDDEEHARQHTPSSSAGSTDGFEVLEQVRTTAVNGTGRVVKRKKSTKGK